MISGGGPALVTDGGEIAVAPILLEQPKVTVVTERDQRIPKRRIDVAVGQPRGSQRRAERVQQHRTDACGSTSGAIERHQLRVIAKARAGQIELVHRPRDGVARVRQPSRIGDHDRRGAAERREAGAGLGRAHRSTRGHSAFRTHRRPRRLRARKRRAPA